MTDSAVRFFQQPLISWADSLDARVANVWIGPLEHHDAVMLGLALGLDMDCRHQAAEI